MEGLPVVALHLVATLVSIAQFVPEQGNERLLVCVFGEFLVVCHVVNILYFFSLFSFVALLIVGLLSRLTLSEGEGCRGGGRGGNSPILTKSSCSE